MTHTRAPQPMTLDDTLDYEDGRRAMSEINRRRTDARNDLKKATDELVEAERLYRKGRATKMLEAKGTVDQKKVWLDGETADLRAKRDGAEWAVKIIQERLEELDGQRASLHRVVEWSMKLDPMVAETFAQQRPVKAA